VARLNCEGQLDSTFGAGGLAPLQTFGSDAIAPRAYGKILVASSTGSLARYNDNGSVDKTFGIFGQAASIASPSASAVQSDGKIPVAGIVRFNPDESIDTTPRNAFAVTL
jgi:hypothetical protein